MPPGRRRRRARTGWGALAVGLGLGLLLPSGNAAAQNEAGINIHLPSGPNLHLVDKAASLGVSWVRIDVNWWSVEPNDDDHRFGPVDEVLCRARSHDLQVYATLAYSPCWAVDGASGSGTDCLNQPPRTAAYTDFVETVVARYSAGIDCGAGEAVGVIETFGLWNEANLEHFYAGADGVSRARDYATRVLLPGAAAVHATCPSCRALGPDLATVGDVDDALEEVLCTPGVVDSLDVLTHHAYNGFREQGVMLWDGDTYDNVLDDQRFSFTRRSLWDVMETCDALGLEVWMTETGDRAPTSSPGDDALEAQARYIELAFEAQLAREWVTNTFVYETVDDTESDIDGYGLWRCPQDGRTFDANCFEKPAAQRMRALLTDNPRFDSEPSEALPACSNGRDDDDDGVSDFPADPGCDSAEDDDEALPSERWTLIGRPIEAAPVIDGVLDEALVQGGGIEPSTLDADAFVRPDGQGPAPGAADLSAQVWLGHRAAGLWLFVSVEDDAHDPVEDPANLWQGDSLQLAFDPDDSGGATYANGDLELGFARADDGATVSHAFFGSMPAGIEVATSREGGHTHYELWIPASSLSPVAVATGGSVTASLLINEADNAGREGWLALGGGIGRHKRPDDFGVWAFEPASDGAGPAPAADAGVDPGSDADAGASDPGDDEDAGAADPDNDAGDPAEGSDAGGTGGDGDEDAGPTGAGDDGDEGGDDGAEGGDPDAPACACVSRGNAGLDGIGLSVVFGLAGLLRRRRCRRRGQGERSLRA